MAANQSIKELMAAETKASKIISEARQGQIPSVTLLLTGSYGADVYGC